MDEIFLVDTGKLEDLKSALNTSESDISKAIDGWWRGGERVFKKSPERLG